METLHSLKTLDGYVISAAHRVAGGRAVYLWLHGLAVDKDEYLGFFKEGAEYLAALGVDSLRIDFRGHGASSGSTLDFSVIGQLMDVDCAMNFLARVYEGAPPSVFVVGCSFGAPPAIYAALNYPAAVAGIALISPVLSYVRTFLRPETPWGKAAFSHAALEEVGRGKQLLIEPGFPIGLRLIQEMKVIRPEALLGDVRQEVVLIHGDADSVVPHCVSLEIARAHPRLKFHPFPGMEHGFADGRDEAGTGDQSRRNKERIYSLIADLSIHAGEQE